LRVRVWVVQDPSQKSTSCTTDSLIRSRYNPSLAKWTSYIHRADHGLQPQPELFATGWEDRRVVALSSVGNRSGERHFPLEGSRQPSHVDNRSIPEVCPSPPDERYEWSGTPIPLLPLYEAGYTSIGCEPCTTVPFDPENPRSGRWQGEKLECGIHIQAK
jgi:hypothetical protein